MEPVRLIVIGAGSRGSTYARYALEHPERATVVGVAEPRDYHRRSLATAHQIPADQVFTDWEEVAARERFADAVIIATQDRLHEAPALAFAAKGYHILLEKPMAPDAAACRRIARAVREHGVMLAVCHIFRYTHATRRLKALIDGGAIGEVVSLQHFEPVGWWHQAHAYVRGNWRKESESGPMLLTKACHDLDWMQYIMGSRCVAVSSFGTLKHFRREAQPEGAADRCLDCAVEAGCPYSAKKIYLDWAARGETGWPMDVLTPDVTVENITEALRTGPYGRCVYACDNDVVDNQVVSLLYEGGKTATFTMNAFNKDGGRKTRIFGTHGEIHLDGGSGYLNGGVWHMHDAFLKVFDFVTQEVHTEDPEEHRDTALSGHGYGDYHLMRHFVEAVRTGDERFILSGAEETLETHLTVFAAEEARQTGRVVELSP